MSQTVRTKKGSELPLMSLKGKAYLQVAHRLQWLADDHERYNISTEFLKLTDDECIARSLVSIYDLNGVLQRSATATKRETKKDFPDFIEKAETGSIGRALAMVGLGTQHAISDLDEGMRLADSPVTVPAKTPQLAVEVTAEAPVAQEVPKKRSSFNPNKKTTAEATPAAAPTDEGWQ